MALLARRSELSSPNILGGNRKSLFAVTARTTDHGERYHNNTILEGQYRGLLATTNCTDLICLRSLDTETLKVAQQQTFVNAYYTVPDGLYGYGDFYYGPSVCARRYRKDVGWFVDPKILG